MLKNTTKKRKAAQGQQEKKSMLKQGLAMMGVVALTAGSLFAMSQMNKFDAPKTDMWLVDDRPAVEVAAQPAEAAAQPEEVAEQPVEVAEQSVEVAEQPAKAAEQPEGFNFMLAGSAAQVYNDTMAAEAKAALETAEAQAEAGEAEAADEASLPASTSDAQLDKVPETEALTLNGAAEEKDEELLQALSNMRVAEDRPDSIIISATGDITLGGNVANHGDDYFDAYVQKYGYKYFLQNFRALFEADDLTLVNLEGPLTSSDDMRSGRPFNFRGKTEYVNILSYGGVDVANVANNHALDFGKEGLTETAGVLEAKGIGVSGFGAVYTTEIKGVRITSLGFTEWDYKESDITNAVKEARKDCDLLIVSMHWGIEKQYSTTTKMKTLGRAAVDAGADLVIGNHTHVPGGIEMYNGKYIVYSLGNFCFGGNKTPFDTRCCVFQQEFRINMDGSLTDAGINLIPAFVTSSTSTNNFQPTIASGDAAKEILKLVVKNSSVPSGSLIWMPDSYPVENGLVQ